MNLRCLTSLIALVGLIIGPGATNSAPSDPVRGDEDVAIRVAFTMSVFRDVHVSDAKASIKVWAETAAKEMDVYAHTEVDFVPDSGELLRRLETERTDLGGATMPEFLELEDKIDLDPIFAVARDGAYTITYLLLVNRDGEVTNLSDLSGGDLRVYDNPRTSLALPWLDLLLNAQGMGSAASHFSQITPSTKLPNVVLPVFFGQADACLVTRSGFHTMAELNPQVERQLRIIAESPGVIPMVTFLRKGFRPSFREDMIEAICKLHTTASGRQILNLIQSDVVAIVPPSAIESSRELIRRWALLTSTTSAVDESGRAVQVLFEEGGQ